MGQKLTKTSESVLDYFYRNPEREVHLRGLEDEIDVPYSSVRNALQELEEEQLVTKREETKMTFYSANTDNERFKRRKRINNLRQLYDSGAIEELEKTFRADALVLFGSYLEGNDRSNSDIDIAVVNGRDTRVDLVKYEKELGRTFQVVQIDDAKTEKKDFRNTLANGYVLRGHLTVV